MITGPTGVGKTFLATAIGNHTCRHGHSTRCMGVRVFMEKMMMAKSDGTYLRLRDRLIKTDLLIIDDVGLKKLPALIVQDLHDLLEERQEKCTLITGQLPLKHWSEIIDDVLALDTVVDKLKHRGMHITFEGESCRKKRNQTRTVGSESAPVKVTNL